MEDFYIKHNNCPTVYKVSQAFIESSNLLGKIFLENFNSVEAHYNKKYKRKENECGKTPDIPYVLEDQKYEVEEIKIMFMTQEHLSYIISWYNAWGTSYKNSFYYIDKPIRQKNYRLTFKPIDTKWFNEFYNFIFNTFSEDEQRKMNEDVNLLICNYIKFLHNLLLTVEKYLEMPFLSDKIYGFIAYVLASATHQDIIRIKNNPEELKNIIDKAQSLRIK